MGDVVHGGAISSLIDTAAAAAAWSGADVPERIRASTIGISVEFLAPARGQGVTAEARVLRRGAITFLAVDAQCLVRSDMDARVGGCILAAPCPDDAGVAAERGLEFCIGLLAQLVAVAQE